jgi:hypothetical protein
MQYAQSATIVDDDAYVSSMKRTSHQHYVIFFWVVLRPALHLYDMSDSLNGFQVIALAFDLYVGKLEAQPLAIHVLHQSPTVKRVGASRTGYPRLANKRSSPMLCH